MYRISTTRLAAAILATALGTASTQAHASPAQRVTAQGSKRIIAQLRTKHAPLFERYAGVRTIRSARIKIKRAGKTETRTLRLRHTAYFYRPPNRKILAAWKNGSRMAPEQAKPKRKPGLPPFPIFARNSAAHYQPRVVSIGRCSGKSCYVIRVRPVRWTQRHLVGTLYVNAQSLQPVRFVGRLARLPTGVKSMHLDFHYARRGAHSVVVRGTSRIRVYIPLLVPRTTLTTSFRDRGHVLVR